MSLPVVAIIGRPNVGKSSLFNRFLRQKLAVVDSVPGVTRDRNYADCEWAGRQFMLVDTGGMIPESKDLMERLTLEQADFAVTEADLVLFVVDTQTGINTVDQKIARNLLKTKKNAVLVANKADNQDLTLETFEFMKLGLGDPFAISATAGLGIGELLDEVVKRLPPLEEMEAEDESAIKVAIVGRPNSGKSSFINKLLGEERLIVSPMAGTTRDSVNTLIEFKGKRYTLIDTAGLRKKYKVHENIEFFTYLRAIRAIDSCDVAVVLFDAAEGLSTQDQHIISEVTNRRRGAVLAVNKWDLIEKDTGTAEEFTRDLKDRLSNVGYLPIIYISALTGQRVPKVLGLVDKVYEQYNRRIPTPELNELLQKALQRRKPPAKQGKYIQIKYLTQSETAPPTFIFFVNHPPLIAKTYIAFLENQLRAAFGFEGVPIRLKFRRK
jgi:GTPase